MDASYGDSPDGVDGIGWLGVSCDDGLDSIEDIS